MTDVAVVVDAANNIGYQVLLKLIQRFRGRIYFTTDDKLTGYKILDEVKSEGLEVFYHHLDVTDTKSIVNFRHNIQDVESGIDLIINNTDYKPKLKSKSISAAEKARRTLNANFYGILNLGKLLYPLLRENGRVVNVSGPAALLSSIPSEDIRNRISNTKLDEDGLVALMQEFELAVQNGIETTEGWGGNVYAITKVALNALTFLQHREWADYGVVINCVNPGHITTKDERKDTKVFEEGADAIIYLALEAPLHVKGNFVWSNYSVVEWNSEPYVEVTSV